ncbi:MAG TPA: SgcJ/EcaC family oxidoreductase [Caulobacteraceae bacterium]|nr:SgcJ/EcaC family oxidoreductase [Caulobacteraceae bacterium]
MTRLSEAETVYRAFLAAWNRQDAAAMAALVAEDGVVIGFDGSEMIGRAAVQDQLATVFEHHATGAYVAQVRGGESLSPDVVLLRAASGMVPHGQSELNPALSAIQSMVLKRDADTWRIALLQNTPAAWHGRPDDKAALAAELGALKPVQ